MQGRDSIAKCRNLIKIFVPSLCLYQAVSTPCAVLMGIIAPISSSVECEICAEILLCCLLVLCHDRQFSGLTWYDLESLTLLRQEQAVSLL